MCGEDFSAELARGAPPCLRGAVRLVGTRHSLTTFAPALGVARDLGSLLGFLRLSIFIIPVMLTVPSCPVLLLLTEAIICACDLHRTLENKDLTILERMNHGL